jgi:hypothetical protein
MSGPGGAGSALPSDGAANVLAAVLVLPVTWKWKACHAPRLYDMAKPCQPHGRLAAGGETRHLHDWQGRGMDVIGIIGLVVAVVALCVPIAIESVKRPCLRITPSEWRNPAFVPWTFATLRVHNDPITVPFIKSLLMRQSAHGCKAEIEYRLWDSTATIFRMAGRWSSVSEPLRFVPSSLAPAQAGGMVAPYKPVAPPVSGGTAPTFSPYGPVSGGAALPLASSGSMSQQPGYSVFYDPTRDPGQLDITVNNEGEQIAVAILRESKAFAFSSESYKYQGWEDPAWRLDLGSTYRVIVRIRGSGVQIEREFKLEYLTNNPSEFHLQEIRQA